MDGDVLVRRLHGLTARRPDRAGDVRGRVLLARAHVEDVDVLPVAPGEQRLHLVGRDEGDALVGGHALGDLRGERAAPRRRLGRPAARAALELEAVQHPAHGPVLHRDDGIGQPHLSHRLGAEVRAGAAAAVDDDGRVRALHQLAEAQHQLTPRHAPRAGQAAARVLLRRARVHDDHVLARGHAPVELEARDLGRVQVVQHALAEDLARRIDTLDGGPALRHPGVEAAGERNDVQVAHRAKGGDGERGQRARVVAEDDRGRQRRHEDRQALLEEPPRQARGPEDVALLIGAPLAEVEHRVGRVALHQGFELGRRDHGRGPFSI